MGTVTRRAVERTWMTASNPKKNRIGSELKTQVVAPDGYCLVGADVDSQELWISSLLGDAQFGLHGATAFGWMTLQGKKSDGTDLHSRSAAILQSSRDHAKVFNYARIYGSGVKFSAELLRQFNPSITAEDATLRAKDLYAKTKGSKFFFPSSNNRNSHNSTLKGAMDRLRRHGATFWFGGSESYMFNSLESTANASDPRTPVLQCQIPDSLIPFIARKKYQTSCVNWVVQSSGVDYLHLLLVSMRYMIRRYAIDARLLVTIHDEIRYLVKKEDAHRAALALQISNLWTRAYFAHRVGMDDLPLSVAFFSAVDVDFLLRKEVDDPCVTPSQPEGIREQGQSCTIYDTLKETDGNMGNVTWKPLDNSASAINHTVSEPLNMLSHCRNGAEMREWLRVQMARDKQELYKIVNEQARP